MTGQALAQARGLVTKHAIKQVDRMLSNDGIDVWDSFARWLPHQIGERRDILVAMDWTDFDHDDQATLALNLVTGHGRAAPLLWLSVWKDELTKQRNDFEDSRLKDWGCKHQSVCHSAGEYARDEDGDGFREIHVNTMEGFWSLLRSWLRPHRGISQEKLPIYLGFF
jgi:hypothetical protein